MQRFCEISFRILFREYGRDIHHFIRILFRCYNLESLGKQDNPTSACFGKPPNEWIQIAILGGRFMAEWYRAKQCLAGQFDPGHFMAQTMDGICSINEYYFTAGWRHGKVNCNCLIRF
jgi:hypothetical protein